MKKKDLFGILENAENNSIERLIEKCPEITDKQLRKILAMSEKKYKVKKKAMDMTNENRIKMTENETIEGVERIRRPAWFTPLSTAASLILVAGIVAGSISLLKGSNGMGGGDDIPPAVTVSTSKATGTTYASAGNETSSKTNTFTTSVDTSVSASSESTGKKDTVSVTSVVEADTDYIKQFAGTWKHQESSCDVYTVDDGERDLGILEIHDDATYKYTDINGTVTTGTVTTNSEEFGGSRFIRLLFSGNLNHRSSFSGIEGETNSLYYGNGGMARIVRTSSDAQLITPDWKTVYKSVLDHYIECGWNKDDSLWDLKDIDHDGTPELFISEGMKHISGVKIFYYENGKVKFVGGNDESKLIGSYGCVNTCSDEPVIAVFDLSQGVSSCSLYKYENHNLSFLQSISENSGFAGKENATYTINGETVSEDEYNKTYAEVQAKNWTQTGQEYSFSDFSALD